MAGIAHPPFEVFETRHTSRAARLPPLSLSKRKREDLDAGIKEFDLKGPVLYAPPLADELIKTRLSNLARTVGARVDSATGEDRGDSPSRELRHSENSNLP